MRITVMIESPMLSTSLVVLLMVSFVGNSAAVMTYPGKSRMKGNPSMARSKEAIDTSMSSISNRLRKLIKTRSDSICRFTI